MPVQDLREEQFIRHRMFHDRKPVVRKYADMVMGRTSFLALLKYELITSVFGPLPGAVGLLLRRIFYPLLFKEVGKGVIFGRNLVLRHCDKMRIGNGVIIDDYTLVDARGAGEEGIAIEDEVIISRGCYIQAKVGPIRIGRKSEVGIGTTIVSQGGIHIDEQVSIGGGCKISGGLFEMLPDRDADPPYRRYSKGSVCIERRCMVGMGVIILDGVTVGEASMVGSGAVVSMNVPPHSISSPRPALVLRNPALSDKSDS